MPCRLLSDPWGQRPGSNTDTPYCYWIFWTIWVLLQLNVTKIRALGIPWSWLQPRTSLLWSTSLSYGRFGCSIFENLFLITISSRVTFYFCITRPALSHFIRWWWCLNVDRVVFCLFWQRDVFGWCVETVTQGYLRGYRIVGIWRWRCHLYFRKWSSSDRGRYVTWNLHIDGITGLIEMDVADLAGNECLRW